MHLPCLEGRQTLQALLLHPGPASHGAERLRDQTPPALGHPQPGPEQPRHRERDASAHGAAHPLTAPRAPKPAARAAGPPAQPPRDGPAAVTPGTAFASTAAAEAPPWRRPGHGAAPPARPGPSHGAANPPRFPGLGRAAPGGAARWKSPARTRPRASGHSRARSPRTDQSAGGELTGHAPSATSAPEHAAAASASGAAPPPRRTTASQLRRLEDRCDRQLIATKQPPRGHGCPATWHKITNHE